MEEIEWTDEHGRTWEGSVLFPPDYRADQSYSMVIQTYGFSAKGGMPSGVIYESSTAERIEMSTLAGAQRQETVH